MAVKIIQNEVIYKQFSENFKYLFSKYFLKKIWKCF